MLVFQPMGIFVILAAVLGVVGLVGLVSSFLVPSLRPVGRRRRRAIIRIAVFALMTVIGVAVLVASLSSNSTFVGN